MLVKKGDFTMDSAFVMENQTKAVSREEIFRYVKETYGVSEDYPFRIAPSYPVMRHEDSRKWFALIMDVERDKLGLEGTDRVDVINVKVKDPFLVELLAQQAGYFRGYHISKGSWISILMDGTVPFEEICGWIDESFLVTASKQKKEQHRPPKEWIIPANPKYFDIVHAFDDREEIGWKQGAGIRTGDVVYLYVAAPVSAILFRCEVTQTDLPYEGKNERISIKALMRIRLLKRYEPDRFTFERLKEEYGIYAVRGPRGISHSLSEALRS